MIDPSLLLLGQHLFGAPKMDTTPVSVNTPYLSPEAFRMVLQAKTEQRDQKNRVAQYLAERQDNAAKTLADNILAGRRHELDVRRAGQEDRRIGFESERVDIDRGRLGLEGRRVDQGDRGLDQMDDQLDMRERELNHNIAMGKGNLAMGWASTNNAIRNSQRTMLQGTDIHGNLYAYPMVYNPDGSLRSTMPKLHLGQNPIPPVYQTLVGPDGSFVPGYMQPGADGGAPKFQPIPGDYTAVPPRTTGGNDGMSEQQALAARQRVTNEAWQRAAALVDSNPMNTGLTPVQRMELIQQTQTDILNSDPYAQEVLGATSAHVGGSNGGSTNWVYDPTTGTLKQVSK